MLVPALILALAAPLVRPAAPTVGDPVTIEFQLPAGASLEVAPSKDYEIVSVRGSRAVVRRFEPGEFEVTGRTLAGGEATPFRVPLRVGSVLRTGDPMKPAPLKPPRELPRDLTPWKWVGAVAGVALFAWGLVFLLARKRAAMVQRAAVWISPRAEFEAAVRAIRKSARGDRSFAALGDATRLYLSRVHPGFGRHLTTGEILRRMRRAGMPSDLVGIAEEVLRQADLAKFSPWGAGQANSVALADRALSLTALAAEEEKAA